VFDSSGTVLDEGPLLVAPARGTLFLPAQTIGEIQAAEGSVAVTRSSGAVGQLEVGDLVYQGDVIETGPDGRVGIRFLDGTAFNLSNNARMGLTEFVCDPHGTSNSVLFSLARGAFAFIAGQAAKTSNFRIDTPFARIRGAAQDGGIGILTLAALAFSSIREIQAASRPDPFLDDDVITYKGLGGTFEIKTKDGRVHVVDDPGETIVVDPSGAVTRIPNSSSRMAELQQAAQQTAALSLGQQGAAPGGSSTPTFDTPLQLQPINFSLPQNHDAAPQPVTINITPATSGFVEPLKTPPPLVVTPVLAADAGLHTITEVLNTTGSNQLHTIPPGAVTFTEFNLTTASASVASITWSGGATPPSGLAAVLAGALSMTTDGSSDSGSIAVTFSAADNNFDFLAANETLTVVYNVTVTDNKGVSLTQPVTITVTGTNDAPLLAADASGPHTTTEDLNTTGTLTFTDVDLNDHHTVSTSVASAAWSGGATLPSGLAAVLAGALSTTTTDSTGSGSGSIAVTFNAADGALDFLAVGQTLTITYEVTVTDNNGVSSTQPVTLTIHGTNDAAVIGDPAVHDVTEDANAGNLTASGTLSILDADQN
jgi:VCBS repeat-containing protein